MAAVDLVDVAVARRLARCVEAYGHGMWLDDLSQPVDLEQSLEFAIGPSKRRTTFVAALSAFVQQTEDTKFDLRLWVADKRLSIADFLTLLNRFIRYVELTLQMATVLEDAAKLLRKKGWVQGDSNGKGFDIIGALNQVDPNTQPVFRAMVLDSIKDRLRSQFGVPVAMSLSDWNDEPGRTATQVITLLEDCASAARTL